MLYRFEAWRRRLLLWVIPAAFCLLNLAGVAVYRANFAGNVEAQQGRVETLSERLAALQSDRQKRVEVLESVESRREAKQELYGGHFATEAERLTAMIRETKRLAEQAGLKPKTYDYPTTEIADWNLTEKRIVFSVEGTYDQLRTFINFLELTEQFLTLERVSLNEGRSQAQNPTLSIRLTLSTIFVSEQAEAGGTS